MKSPTEWTWVEWKVLELSFDETPVPELIQEHHYGSFGSKGATFIPASPIDETANALRDLVEGGAVRVIHNGRTLGTEEINELLAQGGTWDPEPTNQAFLYAVVDEPSAVELQSKRPSEADPHKPRE